MSGVKSPGRVPLGGTGDHAMEAAAPGRVLTEEELHRREEILGRFERGERRRERKRRVVYAVMRRA